MRELAALYAAFAAGRPSPLPRLPIQYADFAVWQRELAARGGAGARSSPTGGRQLGRSPAGPGAAHRPAAPAPSRAPAAARVLAFSAGLAASPPGRWRRREGATLFMVLLAAFQALLHRYTGQDDLVVGTPVANRNRPEIEAADRLLRQHPGPARPTLPGDPAFRELLARVREVALDAYAHQDLPFERLVEELRRSATSPARRCSRSCSASRTRPGARSSCRGSPCAWSRRATGDRQVRPHAHPVEDGGRARRRARVRRRPLRRRHRRAAGRAPRDPARRGRGGPGRRLSRAAPARRGERQQLAVGVEPRGGASAGDAALCTSSSRPRLRGAPDAVAVSSEGETLTYGELDRRADALARRLRRSASGPEVPVALCLERSPEMVVGRAGRPQGRRRLRAPRPGLPAERLRLMLEDSGRPCSCAAPADVLPKRACRARRAAGRLRMDDGAAASSPPVGREPGRTLAYVIYTSGSTGRPKGVVVTHRNVAGCSPPPDPGSASARTTSGPSSTPSPSTSRCGRSGGRWLYGGRLVVVPWRGEPLAGGAGGPAGARAGHGR